MNYDLIATTWDDDNRVIRAKAISHEIRKYIPPSCKTALEFGCGTGLISFYIADLFDEITLIDSSQGMIDVLTEKIDRANVKNMTPKLLDLTKESYVYKKFDIIYTSMVFHHILDTSAITGKLYEMINNCGCICVVDLDKDDGDFHLNEPDFIGHNGFSKSELREIFQSAGFINISIETFYQNIKEVNGIKVPYSLFCLYAEK